CDTWSTGANWTTRMSQLLDQFKINFAFFQIDSCNLDLDFITQTEDLTAVLADQTLAALIKDKEVIAQLAHMHHTIDIEVFQCDKQTKFSRSTDNSDKLFTKMLPHIVTFQPGRYRTRCFIGT